MPRLIDELRAGGRLAMPHCVLPCHERAWTVLATRLHGLLCDADLPVLVIDNVSDYLFTVSDQEHWDIGRDFPNLAPPWPAFWCEHRIARTIHSKEHGDTDLTKWVGNGRVGALIHGIERDLVKGKGIPANAKWVLWCELYIDYGRERNLIAYGPHGSTFLAIDEHGALIDTPWMQSFASEADNEVMKSFMTWFNPTFLAMSFLHCKNVRVEENRVPKALAKKYHEKSGHWPARYQTLVIEPLKEMLRREGGSDAVGVAKAMHICRGHFRDYRNGRGLFGKYKQLVWTPQILRGTRGEKAPAREIEVRI